MAKAIALVDAVHRVTFATRIAGAILGGFFRDADGSTALTEPEHFRDADPSTMLRDPDCCGSRQGC